MFPPPDAWPDDDLVGIGGDLAPATLTAAYRAGLFPMPLGEAEPMAWWSPVVRGVLEPDALHVSRSLRRSRGRFRIRIDAAFADVVHGCADPRRPSGWIDGRIRAAYVRLHELGLAHSVEAWDGGGLAGGLYGVSLGGLFAAESMFTRRTDAGKAALAALCDLLQDGEQRLIDVQWCTPHLASLGARELDRARYLGRLPSLLAATAPDWHSLAAGERLARPAVER